MAKKKWIPMNLKKEESEETVVVETKEDEKMSFISKHKKGLIFGGLGALAAGVGTLLWLNRDKDDDADEEFDDDDFEEASGDEETEEK